MQPGDWFGGDDATPGVAVCVPCSEIITPCSEKFGVLIGRFHWLAFHDCRTDKIVAWDYVVRPRGSYRAEDILNGMGTEARLLVVVVVKAGVLVVWCEPERIESHCYPKPFIRCNRT